MATKTKAPARTPGPWSIHGATQVLKFGENHGAVCIIADPDAATTADFKEAEPGSDRWDEEMANAHLIAASPDLYAALKAIVDHENIDGLGIRYEFDFHSQFGKAARAALAKAEGKS